jgi:membrane protein DedA with SNARE-associated domain
LIRLIQLGFIEVLLIQAINRIRHYYLEVVPEAKSYFSFPQYDDFNSIRSIVLPFQIGFEGFGSAGFQVIVINSILAGAFAGILAFIGLNLSVNGAVVVGVVGMFLGLGLQFVVGAFVGLKFSRSMEFRFPSPEEVDKS